MTARPDQRNVRISDDLWEWLEQERELRAFPSRNELLDAILTAERARLSAATVEKTAGRALDGLLEAHGERQVGRLRRDLEPVLEMLTLEAMQARMMATEQLSYLFDREGVACPHCRKPYMADGGQADISFARERAAIVERKAREALALGRSPKIRLP